MDRNIMHQERGETTVYTLIDIISAAKIALPEIYPSKEELRSLEKYCGYISNLLEYDKSREQAVNNLACSFIAQNNFEVKTTLWKISRIDKKRSRLEVEIISSDRDPAMRRLLDLGRDYLLKNPDLSASHRRECARINQDYQISLVTGGTP